MRKKWIAFGAAAILALTAITGCGGSPAPDKENTPSDQQNQPSQEDPSGVEKDITGTVTDAGMSSTTIETPDGKILTFQTDSSMFTMQSGLLLGDVVTVTYTGDIVNDTDTGGVTVINVTDGANNSRNPLRSGVEIDDGLEDIDTEAEPENDIAE